jgi:L-threonylcarbamoyladenylate synthase
MTAADNDGIARAARWIHAGGVVVFPTETFYGLAVDPTQERAVHALFDLKGRDERAAVPLVASSTGQVELVCGPLTGLNARLAAAYWPGPLSLVFDAPAAFVPAVHGGAGTVAVRVPGHGVARALAAACGHLITATSANRSGTPPASSADALGWLVGDARVHVIDGGSTPGERPSTIVDARAMPPRLVREGVVAWSRVLESMKE